MMLRFGKYWMGLLLVVCLTSPAISGPGETPSPEESQFAFAYHLWQQQDYFRAVTEFKRYLFLYPKGARADETDYLMGEVLLQTKSLKEALIHWQEVLEKNPHTPYKEEIQLKTGRILWELGQEEEALHLWEKIFQESKSSSKISAARAVLWGLVSQKRYDQARTELKTFPLPDSEKAAHEAFIQKAENLPFKSPYTAGALAAVIPGAGHLYLGRPQDALIAFSINGLFTWAAVSSFQQGNSGLGALMTVIELAWYSGNIYSAVNTTHKINRKLENDFLGGYALRFGLFSQNTSSSTVPYLVLQHAF